MIGLDAMISGQEFEIVSFRDQLEILIFLLDNTPCLLVCYTGHKEVKVKQPHPLKIFLHEMLRVVNKGYFNHCN